MFHRRETDFTAENFKEYLDEIIHDWLRTLTALVFTLVPIFFILDYFTMPGYLLPRFGVYRLLSTFIALIQYFIVRSTKAGPQSFLHGYVVSINVGGIIALMTVDLGGFNSSYYAGLNLVIIGVNLLLPWRAIHSTLNCLIIIVLYILLNLTAGNPYDPIILTSNLFFMLGTAIIAVSINHVKHKLVEKEFTLLAQLKKARDALWSEMEIAKRIQTALLPKKETIKGFEIAATMLPAKEVGGDYYDILETPNGERWITLGDVSGHGVDSGLIMMMAQTSICSTIHNCRGHKPSMVLSSVNYIIRENIQRLGSDHYMTIMAIHLSEANMTVAGKHQDIIIYRADQNRTEVIKTKGTWLGITDNISPFLEDISVNLGQGDTVLLFTDGVTEATNSKGQMYGQVRLEQILNQHVNLPIRMILDNIIRDLKEFQQEQMDDITLVIVKKV
ncbi:MAG: PP2C family protein-serine/threonine phosphatase [Thermodesulfobacteriota bacterium]